MNARTRRAIARLGHAASELRASVIALKPLPPMFEGYVTKLETSVTRLKDLEVKEYFLTPQNAQEGEKTERLRKRLRHEYMIKLARVGRRLFRFAPTIEQTLKVPHARASHRELFTAAEVMLKAVRPQQKLLVSEGFSKTFLIEFRDLTRELKRIATTSSQRQAKFTRVSREIREELASGNETLRIIEGLLLGRMDYDRAFAKSWKDALRPPKPLGRPPSKKRKLSPNEPRAHDSGEESLTAR
jgi:hypothetical protein